MPSFPTFKIVAAFTPFFAFPLFASPVAASPLLQQWPDVQLAQYQVLDLPSEDETDEHGQPSGIQEDADSDGISVAYSLIFTNSHNELVMSGDVPATAFKRYMAVRAGDGFLDSSEIRDGAPEGFVTDARAAFDAVRLLEGGRAGLEEDGWFVEGSPAPGQTAADILAVLAGAETSADQWRFEIVEADFSSDAALGDAAEIGNEQVAVQKAEEAFPEGDNTDAAQISATSDELSEPDVEVRNAASPTLALDICRETVAEYMADKAILFPSAGTMPTPASLEMLPGLAERLAGCPDAAIYVEGHTDADGGAAANLSLSIRRAESVVDALVALGVDPARLYAVGYGASLPIAPNTTADGKRQNRRIVFSFEDIARPLP